MSTYNSFTTKASASYSQAAMASSASTTSTMAMARILRNSDARSTSTLTEAAKAIMSFLFEGVQLPDFLSHYAGFFTGFITGALGYSALYTYFHRNQCDCAKVKLAVYHILHVIQHGPEYNALLRDPQALLKHIEAEVMRLVDVHLTQNEATQVTKEIKRSYMHIASEAQVHKRVREGVRDVVKERMGRYSAPAYEHSPRGFLETPVIEQPYNEYEPAPTSTSTFDIAGRLSPHTPEVPRSDTPVQPDTAFVRRELGLVDDRMDIDEAAPASSYNRHVPSHLFGGSPCPPDRLSAAPSAQQSIFVGRVNASTPAFEENDDGYESEVDSTASSEPADRANPVAEGLQGVGKAEDKKREGYGLDYEDEDIYTSDSSSDDEDLQTSRPPTVVRKFHGKKRSGTPLSPIPGSPSVVEGLPTPLPFAHWSTVAELEYSSSDSEGVEKAAPFAVNMSIQPELEFSSSEHGSDGEAHSLPGATTTPLRSPAVSAEPSVAAALAQEYDVCETVEEAGGLQTPKPEVEQENVAPSSPSRKRKSTSPSPSPSPSPSAKRARSSSPLADVTHGPISTGRKSKTPSPPASILSTPNKMPFKVGRGRGRTGPGPVVRSPAPAPAPALAPTPSLAPAQPAVPETTTKQKAKKALKTPATRKSSRLEEKMKKNE